MPRTINQVQLTGRLGSDPEFTIAMNGTGTHITKFSIATERYMGPNKPVATDWHNIVCFNKVADAVKMHLHQGDQVQISGHLHDNRWGTPGQYRSRTEVYTNNVTFLRTKMPAAAASVVEEIPEEMEFVEAPEGEMVAV